MSKVLFFLLSYVLVSFYMFIKSSLENCGNQVRAATDVKSFYAYNTQGYSGKSDGARESKLGL
jgi:hypothetical protein